MAIMLMMIIDQYSIRLLIIKQRLVQYLMSSLISIVFDYYQIAPCVIFDVFKPRGALLGIAHCGVHFRHRWANIDVDVDVDVDADVVDVDVDVDADVVDVDVDVDVPPLWGLLPPSQRFF